ncbi:TonB family protein [Candidatus Sumerlaeota bacterium]|nr:TonB family protein [Candidatus Sumerlaeota bacterium]
MPPETKKPPPPQKTSVQNTAQTPKPLPTPPPRKVIQKEVKKEIPKPQKTPLPKPTKASHTPKTTPRSTPKPKPRNASQAKPKPTPRPQRTVWPPTPRPDSSTKTHPTPAPQPPAPTPSPNTPVKISHSNLPSYYLLMATQKIESNFNLARSQSYEGVFCVVEFKVNKEGNIFDIRILQSTGKENLDQYAQDAVSNSKSLGPLPDSIKDSFISITARFEYSPDGN